MHHKQLVASHKAEIALHARELTHFKEAYGEDFGEVRHLRGDST